MALNYTDEQKLMDMRFKEAKEFQEKFIESIDSGGKTLAKKIKKSLVDGSSEYKKAMQQNLDASLNELRINAVEIQKAGAGDAGKKWAEAAEGVAQGTLDGADLKEAANVLIKTLGDKIPKKLKKAIEDSLAALELEELRKEFESSVEEGISGALDALPSNAFTKAIGLDKALGDVTKDFAKKFAERGAKVGRWVANNWKKVFAAVAIAGIFMAIDEQVNAIGDNFGATSNQMQADLMKTQAEFARLGMTGEDMASTIKTMSGDFGVSYESAREMAGSIADTSKALNMTAQEGSALVGLLMTTAGLSADQAQNFAKGAEMMARSAGIAPGIVMKDIAEASEDVAMFTKAGGENIAKAAVVSRKFGTSLSTVAKTAKGLLNFQDSLNKEMEASIMLGRNINLQKARELALSGDLAGVAMEISKIVGGQAEWDRMGVLEREALAEAVGMSSTELSKFISLQGKSNDELKRTGDYNIDEVVGEKAIGDITELKNEMTVLKMQILGTVASIANLGGIFGDINPILSLIIIAVLAFAVYIGALIVKKLALAGANRILAKTYEKLGIAQKKAQGKKGSGMTMAQIKRMGKASIAMIGFATALGIMALAMTQFNEVDYDAFAMGLASLAGLVVASMALGASAPVSLKAALVIIILAAAVGLMGLAMMAFGYASQLFIPFLEFLLENGMLIVGQLIGLAYGIAAMQPALALTALVMMAAAPGLLLFVGFMLALGVALMFVAPHIETFSTSITPLLDRVTEFSMLAGALLGLAGAFWLLSASLWAVGTAGIFALPALLGIGVLGGMLITGVMGGGETKEEGTSTKDLYDQLVIMNERLVTLEENFEKNWVPRIEHSNVEGAKKSGKATERGLLQNLGFGN